MEDNKDLTEQETVKENVEQTTSAEESDAVEQNSESVQVENTEKVENEGTAQSSDNLKEATENSQKSKKAKKEKKEKPQKKTRKQVKEEKLEARRKEFEGLTDDEIYTKIQTEKLVKSKKNKRLATMITLCVAFVLAICVILLATIPVSLKPSCLSDDFSSAKLYTSTTSAVASITENDERYDTFMKYYNKSFNQTYLNALFSGALFSYEINEKSYHDSSVSDSNGKDTSSLSTIMSDYAGDNYVLQLNYSTAQTFTYMSGKTYTSLYSNSTWDGVIYFTTAYVIINSTEGLQDTNIYLVGRYKNSSSSTGYVLYLLSVTVKADTNVIYQNWNSIVNA